MSTFVAKSSVGDSLFLSTEASKGDSTSMDSSKSVSVTAGVSSAVLLSFFFSESPVLFVLPFFFVRLKPFCT